MSLDFPLDIYSEISQHLPPSDQPAFRKINTLARKSYFDTDWCFRDITPIEVARWILKQREIVIKDAKLYQSKLWKYANKSIPIEISPGWDIYVNIVTGNLDGGSRGDEYGMYKKQLKTEQELLDYIAEKSRKDDGKHKFDNYQLIFDILGERLSCYSYGLTHQELFNTYLAEHIKYAKVLNPQYTIYSLLKFQYNPGYLLSETGYNRLLADLRKALNLPPDADLPFLQDILEDFYGPVDFTNEMKMSYLDIFNNWLHSWLLTLTPKDLNLST